MATGLLVLAVDRSTKLLGHLALTDKTYLATIRLGQQTDTDDADGLVVVSADRATVDAVADDDIRAGVAALTGPLLQVPSSVSAIKVDGRRAYDLVRAGETVELAARPVTVSRFEILGPPRRDLVSIDGRQQAVIDLDVAVDCTTGTYIRSLARDLGAALGIGGHLTQAPAHQGRTVRHRQRGGRLRPGRSTRASGAIGSRRGGGTGGPRRGAPVDGDGRIRRRHRALDHPGGRCGAAGLSGPHRRRRAGAWRCGTGARSTSAGIDGIYGDLRRLGGAGRLGRRPGRRNAVGVGLADCRLSARSRLRSPTSLAAVAL